MITAIAEHTRINIGGVTVKAVFHYNSAASEYDYRLSVGTHFIAMYHIKDILLATDQIRLIITLSQMYAFKLTCFSEIGINALIAGFIKCIGDIFSYPNVFGFKSNYFRYSGIILAKPPKIIYSSRQSGSYFTSSSPLKRLFEIPVLSRLTFFKMLAVNSFKPYFSA